MKEFFKKFISFFFSGRFSSKDRKFKVLEIQSTPNPDAYCFKLNKPATDSNSINFSLQEQSSRDEFASTVFKLYGVENIFIKDDFITITKSPVVGWGTLIVMIEKAIISSLAFYSNKSRFDKNSLKEFSYNEEFSKLGFLKFSDSEKEKIINAIFDQGVRPFLAKDGGDLTLIEVRGEVIRIRYEGACGTCPSASKGTLKFVEEIIRENLNPNLKVISI